MIAKHISWSLEVSCSEISYGIYPNFLAQITEDGDFCSGVSFNFMGYYLTASKRKFSLARIKYKGFLCHDFNFEKDLDDGENGLSKHSWLDALDIFAPGL